MLDIKDLMKKVRYIEISTRRAVDELFSGVYASVFKGQGMEFAEVREYVAGDDIRAIDWNVTARYGRPFTKEFTEERELSMVFVVDGSSSMAFGSRGMRKIDLAAELCAALAFSAMRNADKVGLFLYGSKKASKIMPARGKKHGLRVIRDILSAVPEDMSDAIFMENQITLAQTLKGIYDGLKKKSILFIISDFIMPGDFSTELKLLSARHDVICAVLRDPLEIKLPQDKPLGRIAMHSPEREEKLVIDMSDSAFVKDANRALEEERNMLTALFKKAGVDYLFLQTDKDYIAPLMRFFKERQLRKGFVRR